MRRETGGSAAFLESAIWGGYQSAMWRGLISFVAMALSASAAWAGPHDELIARHAAANGVPEQLVRRIIRIESRGNAGAVHAGNYGLMQIRLGTARGVGYSGDAQGLLDPDINLTYAVKYLAGAYRAAGCNDSRAVAYYQRGYYGQAQSECVTRVAEVLKPKVVRIERIGPMKPDTPVARPTGAFEPVRVAPPPAAMELASVPLPPVRREPDTKHHTHEKKAIAVRESKDTKDSDPAVITFIKKLVTPDKSPHKRATVEEANADPLPHVTPPQ